MNTLSTYQKQYEKALDNDDLALAEQIKQSVPQNLKQSFNNWLDKLAHTDSEILPQRNSIELALALQDHGIDTQEASIISLLHAGITPVSVILNDAISSSKMSVDSIADSLIKRLELTDLPGAKARVSRAINNLCKSIDKQAARLAPRAIDALASVIGASSDQLHRACKNVEQTLAPDITNALAREGFDEIILDQDLISKDDDLIDELFYRPIT